MTGSRILCKFGVRTGFLLLLLALIAPNSVLSRVDRHPISTARFIEDPTGDGDMWWSLADTGPPAPHAVSVMNEPAAPGTASGSVSAPLIAMSSGAVAKGSLQWSRAYDGGGSECAEAVIQTADGGFALAGVTDSYDDIADFWLVKTDADGNEKWNRTYGGAGYDRCKAGIGTADGGFALAGYTESYGAGKRDFWLVKTDANGNEQWNRTYGGAESDWGRAVVETADGGFALAGLTESYGAGKRDFWLVKTDAQGVVEWDQTYGGLGLEEAYAVVQTMDGGFALAGTTTPYGAGERDLWLVKTDARGAVEWDQTYDGSSVISVLQTGDGGIALAGTGLRYSWLVKTDADGSEQWNRTYGSRRCSAIIQTADGGFTLAGTSGGDFWLVKTDAQGVVEWDQTYGGSASERAFAIIETVDGGFALAGDTSSYGADEADEGDFWLGKTSPPKTPIYALLTTRADTSDTPKSPPFYIPGWTAITILGTLMVLSKLRRTHSVHNGRNSR